MPSAQVPGFLPSRNGFHFQNNWGPHMHYPLVTLPVLGTVASQEANDGLCGGFTFAALDLFLHNPPLLPVDNLANPPDPSPLFNYITSRLVDSLTANGAKDIEWMQLPDHDVTLQLFGSGLAHRMILTEWPAIKADIDAGRPSPLALVGPPQCGPGDIPGMITAGHGSHQVLCYAYNLDGAKNLTLSVYDCNQPFNNYATLSLNIGGNPANSVSLSAPSICSALGISHLRGFFRSAYSPKNASAFGLPPNPLKIYSGKFTGHDSLLLYNPANQNWWLGPVNNGQIQWVQAGNTSGFGNTSSDPIYVGSFTAPGTDSVLFYHPADGNWWIGTVSGYGLSTPPKLNWYKAGNTNGFGNISAPPPAHRFFVGAFDGTGKKNVLFFNQYDCNWWLAQFDSAGNMSWHLAANTGGFGTALAGSQFFIGKFSSPNVDSVLFYFPGDNNWWLGTFNGTSLSFGTGPAGNTAGFGNISSPPPDHRFFIGQYTGNGLDSVLFFNQFDSNWWLGTFASGQLSWAQAGNTSSFGGGEQCGVFFTGPFLPGPDSVLFYHPADGNYFLGSFNGNQIAFNGLTDMTGLGFIANDLFFTGNYQTPLSERQIIFLHSDGNWWRGGPSGAGTISWQLDASTGGKAW